MFPQEKRNTSMSKDKWVRCAACGHKLGFVRKPARKNDCCVEIKCHSCKTINLCFINPEKVK